MSFREELDEWLAQGDKDTAVLVPLTPQEERMLRDAWEAHLRENLEGQLRKDIKSPLRRNTLERVLDLVTQGKAQEACTAVEDARKVFQIRQHGNTLGSVGNPDDNYLWTYSLQNDLELLMAFQWTHPQEGLEDITPVDYLMDLRENPQRLVESLLEVPEGVAPQEALTQNLRRVLENLDNWGGHPTLLEGEAHHGLGRFYDALGVLLRGWRKCFHRLEHQDGLHGTTFTADLAHLLRWRLEQCRSKDDWELLRSTWDLTPVAHHPLLLEGVVAFLRALLEASETMKTPLPLELWGTVVAVLADAVGYGDDCLGHWEKEALREGLDALRDDTSRVAEHLADMAGTLGDLPETMATAVARGALSLWAPALHDVESVAQAIYLRDGMDEETDEDV